MDLGYQLLQCLHVDSVGSVPSVPGLPLPGSEDLLLLTARVFEVIVLLQLMRFASEDETKLLI